MNACFAVHNALGGGFLEEVYQESLEIELTDRGIPFVSHPKLQLYYKGRPLTKSYEPDLIVIGEILIELKAVNNLAPEHVAQLINDLRATRKRVGYLVNFAAPRVQWERIIL
jgi:GxxExxY protein